MVQASPGFNALEFAEDTDVIIDLSLKDARVRSAAGKDVTEPKKYETSIGFVLARPGRHRSSAAQEDVSIHVEGGLKAANK